MSTQDDTTTVIQKYAEIHEYKDKYKDNNYDIVYLILFLVTIYTLFIYFFHYILCFDVKELYTIHIYTTLLRDIFTLITNL